MMPATNEYQLGDRKTALKLMAQYAIRDQETLIDALTPQFGKPDAEGVAAITHAKKCIADFRKIAKSAR